MASLSAPSPTVLDTHDRGICSPARARRDGVLTVPSLIVGEKRWHYGPSLADLFSALDSPQV